MKTLIQFILKLVCVVAGIFILSIITESCINKLNSLQYDKQHKKTTNKPAVSFDYYMQLDKDTIYLIDKSGNTIHKEQMNWKTPNKLQLALIRDNL